MATDGRQKFIPEAENTLHTQNSISSELKAAESDSDLRKKSLPSRIDPGPRSSSANDTCSRDTPLVIHIPCRQTKAAFEDTRLLHENTTGDNEKGDESSSPHTADQMTQAVEDLNGTTTASVEKDATSDESEAINTSSTSRTLPITHEEPGNKPQVLLTGPILFAPTPPPSEQVQYVHRDKRKSLTLSEINSCQQPQSADNTKPREPGSQPPTEINAKQKETQGIAIETHHTEMSAKESEMPRGVGSSQSKRSDKETVNIRENIPNDTQDKTEEDTEELSDTIQPLALPPFETNRRRRSSTASFSQFPTAPPSGLPGTSRSRRVSIASAPHFPTPSTSGQTDTSQALQEFALKLQTQSPAESSDVPGTRRGSQSRRSSIAASMLNSDVRDGKKGPIGFTLAASLVKWKMNTLRAAKKAKESIAKDAKHQEFMDRTADRIKTELPRSLLVSIQEEAYPILLRTAQAYRSQLGAKHKLTMQACERLADLMRDLKSPY